MLFDTHCHLDSVDFDEDREQILNDMETRGFTPCVVVGADMPSSRSSRALAQTRPWLYWAAGVHPHDADTYCDAFHDELLAMMREKKCVAWGEIGLDYHYDLSPRETQRVVFARQLDAACEIGKPLILHIREAHGDATDILRARRGKLPQGVVHCYSGSAEQAKIYLDMGFYLGFDGPVTFKKAPRLAEVAQMCPGDRLLVETDSPYMSPEPLRGRRNDPRNTEYIARKLAEIRGETFEQICRTTRENGMRLFGIEEK